MGATFSSLFQHGHTESLICDLIVVLLLVVCAILVWSFRNFRQKASCVVVDETTGVAIQASETLKAIQEEQEHLFASMAHQLKGPLSVASGYAELLRDRGHGMPLDLRKEQLGKIVTNMHELAQILNDGLTAMREGNHGVTAKCHTIGDLNTILNGIRNDLLPGYPALQFQSDNTLIAITADDHALSIILQHLIDNASHYGDSEKAIVLSTKTDTDTVSICVSSTDKENLSCHLSEDIFLPFHHRLNVEPGNGIGLYTVSSLARSMLGRAFFTQDVQAHTTTFVVEFPKAQTPWN